MAILEVFGEVRTLSWAPGPMQTEMLQEAREWSGSEWMRQRPILEGSLKDTFCNQLKHAASSAEIKGHRTIYKLQCSGVFTASGFCCRGGVWCFP